MKNTYQWLSIFKNRRYIPVGLAFCLGIGLSAAAGAIAWKWANNQAKLQFQQQADNLATALQRKTDEYSYMAVSLSAFYAASEQISRQDYEEFTQHFLSRHSGILALGWINALSAAQRPSYEAAIAAEGFANFYIYEQDPAGNTIKAGERSNYYPITFSPQREVIGFDISSEPLGKAALEKTRDTGQLVATTQLPLPPHPETSLAILLAVYQKDAPHDTPQTRRQSFWGAIIGVYSVADIITTSLKGLNIDNLNFCLYDRSAPVQESFLAFYASNTEKVVTSRSLENSAESKAEQLCRNSTAYTRPIKVGDRQWLLGLWRTPHYAGWEIPPIAGVTLLSGLLLTWALVAYLLRSLRHTAEIEAEREKSEHLLLNILPKPIADRLKQNHETIADSFSEVTVLFADIVGFTQLSTQISPTELVNLLNDIFSAFDRLTETYSLEKIKTIGDAYMVASGLPVPRSDHAEAIAEMALGMQQEVKRFNERHNAGLSIRIGINTGPVVAGVIGTKKFIYDLWGDAVNTASRMESHGLAGSIQVTASTYNHLRDKYVFENRGLIPVKGKGEMMAYLLIGSKG